MPNCSCAVGGVVIRVTEIVTVVNIIFIESTYLHNLQLWACLTRVTLATWVNSEVKSFYFRVDIFWPEKFDISLSSALLLR